MFDKKSLKSTALIICSAFIIGISNGVAQASTAEVNSINTKIETVETGSGSKLSEIYRKMEREKARERYERRERYDRNRYDRHRYDRDDRRDRYDRDDRGYPPPPPPRR